MDCEEFMLVYLKMFSNDEMDEECDIVVVGKEIV